MSFRVLAYSRLNFKVFMLSFSVIFHHGVLNAPYMYFNYSVFCYFHRMLKIVISKSVKNCVEIVI